MDKFTGFIETWFGFIEQFTKQSAQTNALNKPLSAGQKIRSINATIMGVPPSYKIEGLGTWNGTFLDKKKLLFVPIKVQL